VNRPTIVFKLFIFEATSQEFKKKQIKQFTLNRKDVCSILNYNYHYYSTIKQVHEWRPVAALVTLTDIAKVVELAICCILLHFVMTFEEKSFATLAGVYGLLKTFTAV